MSPEYKYMRDPKSGRNEMSDMQLRAYGYMAEAMALFLFEKHTEAVDGRPDDEPIFYHYHQGGFERASFDLEKLGILAPCVFEDDEVSDCCFTFTCNADEFRKIALDNRESGPSFDEMLWQFCDLIGDYDVFNLKSQEVFAVSDRYNLVMECLVGLGYAKVTGDGFIWTLKFKPYMLFCHNWISGESANAAIASLSDEVRERLWALMEQGHESNAVGFFQKATGTSTEIASFAIELMFPECYEF